MQQKLRTKIMISYIVIILFIALLLNVFMVETIKRRMIEIQNNNMIASARVMAAEASNYLGKKDYLNLLAQRYAEKNNIRIVFFNENRIAVADSLQDEEILEKRLDYQELIEALNGHSNANVHYLTDTKDWVIYASSPINSPTGIKGAILISAYANNLFDLIHDIRLQIFYLSCFVLVIVSVIGFFFSLNITRPIILLAEAARGVSKGTLGKQVNITNKDEIGQLAQAFNEMSSKLKNVDIKRRRFFHDASHELKTPLTSAILLTDSIVNDLKNGRVPPYEFMEDIKEQLDRLQVLVSKLSMIAKLDDNDKIEYRLIDVKEVLKKIVTILNPIVKNKGLDITCTYNDEVYVIAGNFGQLEHAFTNLIENSIKYTETGGQINIDLQKTDKNIILTISDTGIGIPFEDLNNVFERFYRVDKARARDQGGSGLGLSIAKEIIEKHLGEIEISSEVGVGTIVRVTFPAKT